MSTRVGPRAWRKQAAQHARLIPELVDLLAAWERREGPPRPLPPADIARRAATWIPPLAPVTRIISLLEQVVDRGYQPHVVFEDWVAFAHGMVRLAPVTMRRIAGGEGLASSLEALPEDLRDVEQRLCRRYERQPDVVAARFSDAFVVLLAAADASVYDWIGTVFERMHLGGGGGQFWTPWPLAMAMAETQQLERQVVRNLATALTHPDNVAGHVIAVTRHMLPVLPLEEQRRYFLAHIVPAAQPFIARLGLTIRLSDPACGSGRLLLAAAATVPHWANVAGLVTYAGMDTNATAVAMARLNSDLYGLNSAGADMIAAYHEAVTAYPQHGSACLALEGAAPAPPHGTRSWRQTADGWEVVSVGHDVAAGPPGKRARAR